MRKGVVLLGLLGLALLRSGGGACAQTVFTYSPTVQSIPLTPTNWTPQAKFALPPTSPKPFQVEMFDPDKLRVLGAASRLIGVELRLDYRFDNRLTMRFDNLSTITVTARGTIDMYLPDKLANATSPVPLPGFTKLLPAATFEHTAQATTAPSGAMSKTVLEPPDGSFQSFTGSRSSPVGGYTDLNILAAFT